jgi:hypothetical protein
METLQRSQVLRITLHQAKCTAWNFFSNGDESWFCDYIPHGQFWIPPNVDVPEGARQLITTPKLMITIFWSVSGIYVIDYPPPVTSFDSTYFIDHTLFGFNAFPIISVAVRQTKGLVIHMDNSPIHKSKRVIATMSSMPVQPASHWRCPLDLAPSDFFLFGHLKSQMIGLEFDSPEDLIRWIRAAFPRISRGRIERVFDEWIDEMRDTSHMKVHIFPRSKNG